jgi:hypothetical protein
MRKATVCSIASSAFVNPAHTLETADFRLGKSGKRRPEARLRQKAENLSARRTLTFPGFFWRQSALTGP